jgi:hypothetical protein
VVARRLRRLGFHLVRDPESFFVTHAEGPLVDGEPAHATVWADTLAEELANATALG